MLVFATSEVVRVMGVWVRRADAGLAAGAARNATTGIADRSSRRLEHARTLRDVRRLRPAPEDAATEPSAQEPGQDSLSPRR
jgi:hypothetical protein